MKSIPMWVWLAGGAILVLFVLVPYVTGQPFFNISGGGISLNWPTIKLASGSSGAPAQSTTGVLV